MATSKEPSLANMHSKEMSILHLDRTVASSTKCRLFSPSKTQRELSELELLCTLIIIWHSFHNSITAYRTRVRRVKASTLTKNIRHWIQTVSLDRNQIILLRTKLSRVTIDNLAKVPKLGRMYLHFVTLLHRVSIQLGTNHHHN